MRDREVVIAGAGPVGLLLGCLLSARGVDVLVCERRASADVRTRAIGVHPPGLAALDEAGVGDAVRAEALALDGGEVHARGRVLARVAFGSHRPVLTLAQHRTDALLRARASQSGAVLLPGTSVLSACERGERVTVVVAGPGGEEDAVETSFLVAADGVRSALRAAHGRDWRPRGGPVRFAMVDIADPGSDAVARVYCEPRGLVESFPLPGRRRRWVLRPPDGEVDTAGFVGEVCARTGVALRIGDGDRPVEFVAAQHRARPGARGRIVLVGDAAHEVSPIGGQGMNLGWASARVLADELVRALGERRGSLGGYERVLQRRAADAQRRSAFYMAMGSPVPPSVQRVREVVIRALGSPPLRGGAASLVTMSGLAADRPAR